MSNGEHIGSRPSFNQNLENARVLIEDAPWRDNPEKYRKVAEGILRRILKVDPANDSARRLLVKALVPLPQAKTPAAPPVVKAKPVLPHPRAKAPQPAPAAPRRPVRPSDLSFVVQRTASPVEKKKPARSSPWGLVGFTAVVAAIAGILMFVMRPNTLTTQYVPKSPITPPAIVHASGDMTGNNAASFRYSTD